MEIHVMAHLMPKACTLLRESFGAVLDKARSLRDLAADVGKYTVDRLRDRHRGSDIGSDPVEMILDQIILKAGYRLIDIKKAFALGVADQERLVKMVEFEAESAAEWARRSREANTEGNLALADEAHKRERAHAEHAHRNQTELEQQKTDIERLKSTLHALHYRIEDAKRTRGRIVAYRRAAPAQRTVQQEVTWVDEAVRLLEDLAAIDGLVDKEKPSDSGNGQGSANGAEPQG
jgi:phage shock protein A